MKRGKGTRVTSSFISLDFISSQKSVSTLPQEILVDIFCRLPMKSLLRLTSVCKSWHYLITDPSFISYHHSRSSSSILLQVDKQPYSRTTRCFHCSLRCDDPLLTAFNPSLSLPSPIGGNSKVVAILHGLICLTCDEGYNSIIICNPSIRRYLSVPKPYPYHDSFNSPTVAFGFGFDSRNSDYKVVKIVSSRKGRNFSKVQIYSLACGFWRKLRPNVAPFCIISWTSTHNYYGFVNGQVHWGAKRMIAKGDGAYYLFVLSFDFKDEVFHEIELPECLACTPSNKASVIVVGGGNDMDLTIYHLDVSHVTKGSIWVMKEYGIIESWNKLFAFDLIDSRLEAPSFGININRVLWAPASLCVTNNREIILMMYSEFTGLENLCLLDVEKRSFVDLRIMEHFNWRYIYVGYYAESLVLIDNAVVGALISY